MTGQGVRVVDPRTEPAWQALSLGPGGGLFTSPPWISAVAGTYDLVPAARVAFAEGGTPVSGLVWADVTDLRGRRRIAFPFSDRADPILTGDAADRAAGWAAVSADALDGDRPFTLRCLDGSPAVDDPRLAAVGDAAWHRTALDIPLDALHRRLRSQTRRNIATAARSGVEVTLSADLDAVLEFRALHVGLRKHKYRLLPQSREFFEHVWKAFAPLDAIRVGLARHRGVPVAGALYLVWGDTVYYKFGASAPEHLALRPNDALHWELIRWAGERGLAGLDWGLSDRDQPGLVRYKAGWASTERSIRTLRSHHPAATDPEMDGLLRAVTGLLTDPEVPDRVTDAGGALLYRYFC